MYESGRSPPGCGAILHGMTPTEIPRTELAELYRDLHANPELSFQETRTAGIVADRLTALGYRVHTGIGGTGVVGVLANGAGPVVLLRADMDALPLAEKTGLPYASSALGVDRAGTEVPVMHACGHDVHVTCLLGAAAHFAAHPDEVTGTLIVLFQPAEELGAGARAMVDDGLFDVVGRPDVVLGQHVAPIPAGALALHPGLTLSASDSLNITLHGRGGHGSRPETTVDPVVMAAATVMRLQTVVSRETAGSETAVVTVGMISAGSSNNVIPDEARLRLNVRTQDPNVRARTLAAIERIVRAEAEASGAPCAPDIDHTDYFPALINDDTATTRTRQVFVEWLGEAAVLDPGPQTGSEDVGVLADSAGVPCCFWFLGGADPALFAGVTTLEEAIEVVRRIPSNHSPQYAPVIEPTLSIGVEALVRAARNWLSGN